MSRICSPSEGRCCKSECIFVASSEDLSCAPEDECSFAAKCDGTSAYCPSAKRKEDGLECAEGTKVSSEEGALAAAADSSPTNNCCRSAERGPAPNPSAPSSVRKSASRTTGNLVRWAGSVRVEIHNWAGYF